MGPHPGLSPEQSEKKRMPESVEYSYRFSPEGLIAQLKLEGERICRIAYDPVAECWRITTKEGK